MNTKNIIYGLAACLLMLVSCTEIDNYDAPDATLTGKILDAATGEPFITGQGEMSIRMWETSWSDSPSPQDIVVMQDGTYRNTKLFSGTYKIIPYSGAFWPVEDTVTGFQLNGAKTLDFTVTPYLQIIGLQWELSGSNKLTISCKLKAPITQDLPTVMEVRPFVSLTPFCGAGNRIDEYFKDQYRVNINQNWWDGVGDMSTGISNQTYSISGLQLKGGRSYYVRMGAKVRDTFEQYNYSEVIKIDVPAVVEDPDAIPDNYFKNGQFPFEMATWDGDRWGTLTEWITNDAMRSRGGGQYGGYDGGYGEYQGGKCSSFGFERWGEGENPIRDGKIYQTFTLPAGKYKYTFSFGGDNPLRSNNGSDPRFIVAAAGETLPDVGDIGNSLANATLVGVGTDEAVSVEFTLAQETKVSAGVVVDWTNIEQNIRASSLKLEKID